MRLIALLLLAAAPAAAATLAVGPNETLRTPSAAAAVARPGDTVSIAPGRYQDCATWRTPGVRIAARQPGTVTIAGPVCGDKALFVVAAADVTIEGLSFAGAVASPGNGAGIRAEGTGLRVLRSRFEGNQNGILVANLPGIAVTIEDSAFVANGALLGDCAHGLYAGAIAQLTIRRTRFEGTRICHHVKSRAAVTEIEDSAILDGPDGLASYLVDIPDGGALRIERTLLRKGPRSGNDAVAVTVAVESRRRETPWIVLRDNRFENLLPASTILVRNRSATAAELIGNVLAGPVKPLEGPGSVR